MATFSDPCSFSNPECWQMINLHVALTIDFQKQTLIGKAILSAKKLQDAEYMVFDTRDLSILSVIEKESGQALEYTVGDSVPPFGSKLSIKPPAEQSTCSVVIEYETSPQSTALQWLKPEQTAGKRQPYLFSQCQAIHARSMVPCQDSPGVKFPYTAEITARKEVTVLMSALRLGCEQSLAESSKSTTRFEQKVPIPAYLIALVAGDIECRDIGPRSKVWSEKEIVNAAAYEFAETENMLQTAENLLGPYVWGHYDLLVLPPSFPFGGMENPCLTFVTPTLLAGDRSLADVVAHEISHSWTGNLVTNKSPEHFWLNEGHTVFVERKIASMLHGGEPFRHFKASGGWKELLYCVNTYLGKDHPYTKLIPDLKGVDPDDAFSTVPYEKGFALLFYLETLVGGKDIFDPFLKAYIEKFKYQSITTDEWKNFLLTYFDEKVKQGVFDCVDWDAWFNKVGMPPYQPNYDLSLAAPCEALSTKWNEASDDDLSAFTSTDLESFSSVQIIEFLALLLQKDPLSCTKVKKIEDLYKLNSVKNSEIRFRWIRLGILAHWHDAVQQALRFINEQGRMKFVRPIYRDLYGWEESRDTAIKNFKAHEAQLHNITAKAITKDLHLSD